MPLCASVLRPKTLKLHACERAWLLMEPCLACSLVQFLACCLLVALCIYGCHSSICFVGRGLRALLVARLEIGSEGNSSVVLGTSAAKLEVGLGHGIQFARFEAEISRSIQVNGEEVEGRSFWSERRL